MSPQSPPPPPSSSTLLYDTVKAKETGKRKDEGMYEVTGGVNGIKEGKGCESPFARMRHKKGSGGACKCIL